MTFNLFQTHVLKGFLPAKCCNPVWNTIDSWALSGGKIWGSKSVGWENWLLDHNLRSTEPHIVVSVVLSGLKCSGSYSKASETFVRLLA